MHPIEAYADKTNSNLPTLAGDLKVTERTLRYYIAGRYPEPRIVDRIWKKTGIQPNELHLAWRKAQEAK